MPSALVSDTTSSPTTPPIGLRQYVVLVGVGTFATTFAQSRLLANLPTTFLLKNQFHLPQQDVAFFFFWVTFPWLIKPLVGVLADAFPLFGTRRRHYMMLGSAAAGIAWAAMGPASVSYTPLLLVTLLMNVATIFPSTVMGGLMVEAGQAYGASGRMSSLRQSIQSVAGILAPTIGGYLAARAYGWTTAIGAVTALGLTLCAYLVLREPEARPLTADAYVAPPRPPAGAYIGMGVMTAVTASLLLWTDLTQVALSLFALVLVLGAIVAVSIWPTRNAAVVRAQLQLSQVFASRTLWFSVAMIFLVYTVPGLNTSLVYRQTDVLQFSTGFIGMLGSIEGALGVAAAGFYAAFCGRFNLRTLLVGGVGLNGLFTLLYLIYTAGSAPYIHAVIGFVSILTELAIMDLAIRSTPAGCESLGFALLISVRNFGVNMSDVIGTQMVDTYHVPFNSLVVVNALTTIVVLLFVPFLPKIVLSQREGDVAAH